MLAAISRTVSATKSPWPDTIMEFPGFDVINKFESIVTTLHWMIKTYQHSIKTLYTRKYLLIYSVCGINSSIIFCYTHFLALWLVKTANQNAARSLVIFSCENRLDCLKCLRKSLNFCSIQPIGFAAFLKKMFYFQLNKFCPHRGSNSQPRAQHSNVQSWVLYHSAIQAPLRIGCFYIVSKIY